MKFYSEFGEDEWLFKHDHFLGGGRTYVDVGAGDPITGSNTAFVRWLGWNGLAIDANPVHALKWKTPFELAVVSTRDAVPFNYHPNDPLSRVEEGNEIVAAVTLESLLNKHDIEKIDLLSLDVEGHEFEALSSMDLERHQPRIIISEFNTFGLPMDWRVRDYLMDRKYKIALQTFANLVFFHIP